jgi:hypothetical protein
MSKLAEKDKFIDLSDYGRPFAKVFVKYLVGTRFTSIHVTLLFGVVGLLAIWCIIYGQNITAGCLLILKSIIDAADGELAREKNRPSYVGRYLDSVLDIILNFGFLLAIFFVVKTSIYSMLLAFFCIQLQGTLYNYYYVVLRHSLEGGDDTSKIFENEAPTAYPYESQSLVNILFVAYKLFYGVYDWLIHKLDQKAANQSNFPNWFMTIVSVYGLGFQLLIMAILLALQLTAYIIPFFIFYTILLFVIILIRIVFLQN